MNSQALLKEMCDDFCDIENAIMCYLVNCDVLPGCVNTYVNGKQSDFTCTCGSNTYYSMFNKLAGLFTTKYQCKVHAAINKWFPDLKVNNDEKKLISKDYIEMKTISNYEKTLGYPGWDQLIDKSKEYYVFGIVITFKNYPKELHTMLCQGVKILICHRQTDISAEMEEIKNSIVTALITNYSDSFAIHEFIDEIYVKKQQVYPLSDLVNKVMNYEDLDEQDKFNINNSICNLVWNNHELAQRFFDYEYQFSNPVHVGIIVTLLTQFEYDVLEPLYQYNEASDSHETNTKFKQINEKYFKMIMNILETSKTTGKLYIHNKYRICML